MGFVVVFAVIALMFFLGHRDKVKTHATWAILASELHLQFVPATWSTGPNMSGEVRDMPVRIYVFQRGSGKNRTTFTGYEVHHKSSGR
ncbi:MAG: hypothetical protein ACI91O_001619 [Candidatus Poriferisodalaceae bacterium]|jgi:hypothetical protein